MNLSRPALPARTYWRGACVGMLLAIFGLLVVSGCTKPEPIRIGFVDSLTGPAGDLGQSNRDGVLLAIEKRNASGGVRGRQIELIIKDDANDPDTAQTVVRELLDQNVVAIIGHGTSNTTIATAPIANAAGTVMISPTATSRSLSGKYGQFFRVVNATDKYAIKTALFRRHTLKEKRIAITYDTHNLAYTQSWLEDFRSTFEREGGVIVNLIPFDSLASPRPDRIARQLLRNKPDGVQLIARSGCVAQLSKQIRLLNSSITLGTSEWGATEKLIDMGGRSVEGIYSSQFIDRNSPRPEYVAFRNDYQHRFGRNPGFGGVLAYDATNVILEALEKNPDRATLSQTILSIRSFDGLQGKLSFDDSRESDRPSYITTVLHGRFRTYEN